MHTYIHTYLHRYIPTDLLPLQLPYPPLSCSPPFPFTKKNVTPPLPALACRIQALIWG